MNLLFITQKVDKNDDLLGIYHEWLKRLASKCESLFVICLYKGEYNLPKNVKVFSLGKESGCSRIKYLKNFYKYIWLLKKNYDSVFIHMNQIYVLLGGLLWHLWNKKIALWYNHRYGNLLTRFAGKLAHIVFYTSPFAFTAQFKNAKIMPAGIDIDKFKVQSSKLKVKNSILFLGRISPVKNLDILIKAAEILDKKNINFILNIVGEPGEKDKPYFQKIKELSKELENKGKVRFFGKIPNYKTPEIYNQNEIFINLTPSGSLDKTVLEAMACEELAVVSNRSFENIFPKEWHNLMLFQGGDVGGLADKIKKMINLDSDKKNEIGKISREIVVKNHSLANLTEDITASFNLIKL